MSAFTKFLNLFKWQPDIDGDEEFDIDKSLNENWDKIDTKLETYMTNLSKDVEDFKNNTDIQVEDIANQVSGLREIAISPTTPTSNESVWIKKGKNAFNGNNVLIVNTSHTTNNISKNGISITTTGNYANSRFKVMIPNEFINKKVSISFNAISTVNGSTTNIRNTLYISSENNDTGDILTQALTTTKTRYNVTFTPTTKEIYITLYGNSADYSTFITMTISEIQLEQNPTATVYEEYIDKEIYVKNENGVFERFYSESEMNKQNYSIEEQKIGTWIDGKPLYRKVIQQNFNLDWTDVSLADINADTIFVNQGKTYAKFTVGENQYINGQFYNGNTDFFRAFIVNSSNLTVVFAPEMTNRMAVITLEYTKTTD